LPQGSLGIDIPNAIKQNLHQSRCEV
jgi:hypothetical protein